MLKSYVFAILKFFIKLNSGIVFDSPLDLHYRKYLCQIIILPSCFWGHSQADHNKS